MMEQILLDIVTKTDIVNDMDIMKKKIVLVSIIVISCCLVVFLCDAFVPKFLTIKGRVSKITITNGNNGKSIDIVNEKEIKNIVNQINELGLRKDFKLPDKTGWTLGVYIYDENGDKTMTMVVDDDGVEYRGYLYDGNDKISEVYKCLKEKL